MKIGDLIKDYTGEWKNEGVRGIAFDTSMVQKGDLFFALKGKNYDGNDYAREAIKKGAIAVVSENINSGFPCIVVKDCRKTLAEVSRIFFGEPDKDMQLCAITGTNGKTTTSFMLNHILKCAGKKTALIGTNGVYVGEKKFPPSLTTPDPPFLYEYFHAAVDGGVTHLTMEASAHALYLKKLHGLKFKVAAFTNFSQDHLDYFGTMQEYLKAKLTLFENCENAVINADDESCRKVNSKITYGIQSACDFRADCIKINTTGSKFCVNYKNLREKVFCPLVGRYNIYNALCAVACAVTMGIDFSLACNSISIMNEVEGRINCIALKNGSVIIDFAHTPDALEKVLVAAKEMCKGKLTLVFGCGGNRDKSKRPIMGEIAAKYANRIVVTSDNPRWEEPNEIISEIVKGIKNARFDDYYIMPDRARAIEFALFLMEKNDIVVIAGKGAEDYQEIRGEKIPFSDKAIVLQRVEEQ